MFTCILRDANGDSAMPIDIRTKKPTIGKGLDPTRALHSAIEIHKKAMDEHLAKSATERLLEKPEEQIFPPPRAKTEHKIEYSYEHYMAGYEAKFLEAMRIFIREEIAASDVGLRKKLAQLLEE
jgi:hypothetical protein